MADINQIYLKMDAIREEQRDIHKQRAMIIENGFVLKASLLTAKSEKEKAEIRAKQAENVLAILKMDARARELKADLHILAAQEGTIFERSFLKVAKANLSTRTFQKLVDQATQLAGLRNKKKE